MDTQPGTKIPGTNLWVRRNERGHNEYYISEVHVDIDTLRQIISNIRAEDLWSIPDHMTLDDLEKLKKYIVLNVAALNERNEHRNVVPHCPRPVEFHVSRIAHVTTEEGLYGILDCGGFRGGKRSGLLWWGLVIGQKEIYDAEQRYLERILPDCCPEHRWKQNHFLYKFITSPVFMDGSRYGNFRFSFSLAEVLQAYSTQFCGGQKPVAKMYETVIYKQEIMYTMLIHSPDNEYCKRYKRQVDIEKVLIWDAQAISETHGYRLIVNEAEKQVYVEGTERDKFYVWDHMTLAFHMPTDNPLTFPPKLREALTVCDQLNRHLIVKSVAEDIIIQMKLQHFP